MKTKHTWKAALTAAVMATLPTTAEQEREAPREGQAKVQLAILLDTSSSMSGLIDQARTQLWKIINTFIDAKQNGQVPFVEVALYQYGNNSLPASVHWIQRIQPLTRDLDKVSEELFKLSTNGGEEYCGTVIRQTVGELAWDPSHDVYKAIFIAGNEPFTQGPVDPSQACHEAIAKGVIVNTIHCGSEETGIATGWKSGAVAADGTYQFIDHNKAVVHIDAPQDAEIVKLNEELNKTYLAYGSDGSARANAQVAQDALASEHAAAGAAVQRAVTKASANYSNTTWDLVDAAKEKDFQWAKVKEETLPEEMRTMSPAERAAHVEKMANRRTEIQGKIQALNKQREEFVAGKRRELAGDKGNTLDEAVVTTVRNQAAAKGYQFEK